MFDHRPRLVTPAPDPVELEEPAVGSLARTGVPTGFSCPECHGGIWEIAVEGAQQYRCWVGHAFTGESLFSEQRTSIEAALWTALRALEESAEMATRLSGRAKARGNARAVESYRHSATTYDQRATVLRDLLRTGLPHGSDGELSVSTRPVPQ